MASYQANPEKIIYIGRWENSETEKIARTNCSKAVILFRGTYLRLTAEGEIRCALDGGEEVAAMEFTVEDGVHTLFLTASRGARLRSVEAEELLNADVYLRSRLRQELEEIKQNRPVGNASFSPVSFVAAMPETGVRLTGFFGDLFQKSVERLKTCAKYPPYHLAAGENANTGWASWLPSANDGRLLVGAAKSYLWTKDPELLEIVNRLVETIAAQTREDGYSNYYPPENAYGNLFVPNGDNDTQSIMDSEQKNFDRGFWTLGMIAAGAAGSETALTLARNMYDWLYRSPYKTTLHWGHNATNAFLGTLFLAESQAGTKEDILFQQQYVDLHVLEEELIRKNPLIFSNYPADRPHCYLLLALLAAVMEYRLTGDRHYLDAATGGWQVYDRYYKHVGGLTAICESDGPYYPGSYYMATGHTGETCGSVFWTWINAELAQLFPEEPKYADRIEEVLFNVLPSIITPDGHVRYHNRLQGEKDPGNSISTCCEISGTNFYAELPRYVFSYDANTIYVNQFISAEVDADGISLSTEADLFDQSRFTVTVTKAADHEIKVRIPHWAENAKVSVNGETPAEAVAGTFYRLSRKWEQGDTITVTFTPARRLVLYTGAEQMRDGVPTPPGDPRYALFCGPVLMALTGDYKAEVPTLRTDPCTLDMVTESKDRVKIPVDEKLTFVPYEQIDKERFCVFPAYRLKQQPTGGPSDS